MKIVLPDWNNNILNISSSFAKYIGVDNFNYTTIPELDSELSKNYKNVVFMLLDALGTRALEQHLKEDSLLRRNFVKSVTSTFPSTTTNATTTVTRMCYPGEHNWLGWSLYFDEVDRCIDIFLNTDSYTGEVVENFDTNKLLPGTYFFERERERKDISVSTVCPTYFREGKGCKSFAYENEEQLFIRLNEALNEEGNKFIYCYCPQPDATMHMCGVSSEKTHTMINYLNDNIEKVLQQNEDTLIVITADHGQVDITTKAEFYLDKRFLALFERPLCLDSRAVSVKLKEGVTKEQFISEFNRNKRYSENFTLLSVDELIKQNVFGKSNETTKRLLGDYILVGNDNGCYAVTKEKDIPFLGAHSGLTEREMYVPLIMLRSKKWKQK